MTQLTQMAGLAFHNFVSAAAGAAVAVALIRGLVRRRTHTLGNFWVDLVRTCTRILLPFAFVVALVLVSQGAIQNFHANRTVTTVTGQEQTIPGGPIASQEAIKEIGENGGGPFNANSIHPYENPNAITNVLEIWALLAIPFGFTYTFGKMAKDQKQGWVVFATMFVLWVGMTLIVMPHRGAGKPELHRGRREPVGDRRSVRRQHGRQGRRASARRSAGCSRRRRPARRPARSTASTTACCRSAARCRSST